jgi:hypothetical protein
MVAHKYRESQIVAHLKHESHTTPLYYNTTVACNIILILAGIREQMAFVIVIKGTIGTNKIQAIAQLAFFINGSHTTYYGSISATSLLLHPAQNLRSLNGRMLRRTFGKKTSGKGLGEHIKIGSSLLVYQRRDVL